MANRGMIIGGLHGGGSSSRISRVLSSLLPPLRTLFNKSNTPHRTSTPSNNNSSSNNSSNNTNLTPEEEKQLYNELNRQFLTHIANHQTENAWESYQTILETTLQNASLSVLDHRRLLRMLSSLGSSSPKTLLMNRLLENLEASNAFLQVADYVDMLSSFERNADLDGALRIIQDMERNGCKPNLEIFHSLMRIYAKKGKFDQVTRVFYQCIDLESTTINVNKPRARSLTFTIVMKAYATAKDAKSAKELLDKFEKLPYRIIQRIPFYIYAIRALESGKDVDGLRRVWQIFQNNWDWIVVGDHIKPTLQTIPESLLSIRRPTIEFLPTTHQALSDFAHHLVSVLSRSHNDAATSNQVLTFFESKYPNILSLHLYHLVMRAYLQKHPANTIEIIQNLFTRLQKHHLTPNIKTFMYLLSAHAHGTASMEPAFNILAAMERPDSPVQPDLIVYKLVLQGILRHHAHQTPRHEQFWKQALEIVNKVFSSNSISPLEVHSQLWRELNTLCQGICDTPLHTLPSLVTDLSNLVHKLLETLPTIPRFDPTLFQTLLELVSTMEYLSPPSSGSLQPRTQEMWMRIIAEWVSKTVVQAGNQNAHGREKCLRVLEMVVDGLDSETNSVADKQLETPSWIRGLLESVKNSGPSFVKSA